MPPPLKRASNEELRGTYALLEHMTKLDAALLKLEGALDYTTDPRVRTLIDVAQQAIEAAKQVMAATPQEVNERIELAYAAHNGPHLSEQQRRAA